MRSVQDLHGCRCGTAALRSDRGFAVDTAFFPAKYSNNPSFSCHHYALLVKEIDVPAKMI
jgi:hypothetical protein